MTAVSSPGLFKKVLVLLTLAWVFGGLILPTLRHDFPAWSRYDLMQDRVWITLSLVLLSPLHFLIPRQYLGLFYSVVMLLGWSICGTLLGLSPGVWLLHPIFFFLMYFTINKISCTKPTIEILVKSTIILTLFGIDLLLAGWVASHGSPNYLTLLSKFRFEYILIFALFLIFSGHSKKSGLLLQPLQLSHAIPLPQDAFYNPATKNWWRGIYNVSLGSLLSLVLGQLALLNPSSLATTPFLSSVLSSFFLYFYFCLFVIASMNIISGLARIFGLELRDGTYFLFLAKSPLEFWRRSSTYLYQFVINYVFLPIVRRTRSTLAAVSLSAIFTLLQIFFLHEICVRGFLKLAYPQLQIGEIPLQKIAFVALAYLTLWVGAEILHRSLMKGFYLIRAKESFYWLPIYLNHSLIIFITYLFLQSTK